MTSQMTNSAASASVTIRQPEGWHARPAAEFARIVDESGLTVTIGRAGEPVVRGDSVLSLLTLGARFGQELHIEVTDGDPAQQSALLNQLLVLF